MDEEANVNGFVVTGKETVAVEDDDDDWAEFASHGDSDSAPAAATVAVAMSPTWPTSLEQIFPSFPPEAEEVKDHVPILPRADIQEMFMCLITKKNSARVTSLPGRPSLWLDILPIRNFVTEQVMENRHGAPTPSAELNVPQLVMVLNEISFDLDLPTLGSSPTPTSASPTLGGSGGRRLIPFFSEVGDGSTDSVPEVVNKPNGASRSQSLVLEVNVSPSTSSTCTKTHARSTSDVCVSRRKASPDPALGFAEDVAARGLARLSGESLQEMYVEMREKAYQLSDELVSGLERRDRLLRSIKTRNEFVSSLLQLQNAINAEKARKPSDKRKSIRGDNGRSNKFLATILSYRGDPSLLAPSALERLTDVMNAMVAGSNDVSSLMRRYLAIDVFKTDNDDVASPPMTPFCAAEDGFLLLPSTSTVSSPVSNASSEAETDAAT